MIEYINVAHSIPEPNALAIRDAARHGRPQRRLEARRRAGARAADRRGALGGARRRGRAGAGLRFDQRHARRPQPERDGGRPRARRRSSPRRRWRVAFTTFASNVGRLRSIALAAGAGRPRSRRRRPRACGGSSTSPASSAMLDGLPPFLDEDAYQHLPRDKVVALLTGSQGEPRAALARVVEDEPQDGRPSTRATSSSSPRAPSPATRCAINRIINGLIATRHSRHHRPRPPRPCLGPSAPRRAARDVCAG